MSSSETQKKNEEQRKKPYRNFSKKPEEKGIPMLKFGKANNFYKFRQALSNKVMEKFGNIGKLIDLEQYYIPTFMMEDYQAMGFSDEQVDKMNLERFREHTKKLTKMEEDRPKLYGLMMRHMSVESKDEVAQEPEYDVWHAEKDPEK
jgi:hypothetical protein